MKKWKQLLLVAGLTLCFSAAAKTNADAADPVTGVKQNYDSQSGVGVQCDAVLGASYYYLDLSADNQTWVTVDASTSPTGLRCYSLNAGASYYARVGLCSDYYAENKIAGTESASIEVVTAPSGVVGAQQVDAKTNGFTVKGTAIPGSNFYRIYYRDAVLIGESSSSTVATTTNINPGTSFWCYFYACRRSASGYVAEGSYDYDYFKTLAPAINTKSFGVTNAWSSLNSYQFGVSSSYARDGLQFQFATPKGKVKKTADTTSSSVDVNNFIKGNFYKYRVRSYVQCGTEKKYSDWSAYKYIGVPKNGTFKLSKNRKSLSFSFSKVSNASSFIIYTSTKENSGYKKVKTVSAKKRSVTVKKVGGKKLKKNVTYYFRVVPVAKVGKKSYKSQTNAWYSYKFW